MLYVKWALNVVITFVSGCLWLVAQAIGWILLMMAAVVALPAMWVWEKLTEFVGSCRPIQLCPEDPSSEIVPAEEDLTTDVEHYELTEATLLPVINCGHVNARQLNDDEIPPEIRAIALMLKQERERERYHD